MSDLIESLKLVDGNGNYRTLSAKGEAPTGVTKKNVLLAAQTSLGVFGAVVQYTMKVMKMSTCRVQNLFNKKVNVWDRRH